MPTRSACTSILLTLAGLAAPAHAQVRLERPDMPYAPPPRHQRVSVPIINFDPTDDVQSQVNINAQGLNILGDAANEPSLAIDPTAPNRLAVGWRQFDTVTNNFRQAGRAYSRDGGRTWTNPGVLTPGTFRSDPCLRADSVGNIYYCSLTNSPSFLTAIFKSTDGGATFGAPSASFGGDKQWLAIDRTGLASAGTQYQHWSTAFSRSFTMGATWSNPLGGTPVWGTNAVGPTGTLYIAGVPTAGGGSPIEVARSTNASNSAVTPTFTTVTVNLGGSQQFNILNGPSPAGLLGQANVDVDRSGGPRNGWVYVVCSVNNGADPVDVMFNRSTDAGQTWMANPIRINNDAAGNWQWFATLGVAPNGRIDVVWNDSRESGAGNLSRLYYAFSNDGGTTWQGNTPVAAQFNSLVGFPQQNKIGDYYDMVSDRVGASIAYAATYNGEQDVYFLRINDFDCNSNGIADATDLAAGTLHDCNANGVPDECEIAAGVTVICPCYANCDNSTTPPVLNVLDFSCFLNRFAASDPYTNCDNSTTPPVLNVLDFACFLNKFAAGCS